MTTGSFGKVEAKDGSKSSGGTNSFNRYHIWQKIVESPLHRTYFNLSNSNGFNYQFYNGVFRI